MDLGEKSLNTCPCNAYVTSYSPTKKYVYVLPRNQLLLSNSLTSFRRRGTVPGAELGSLSGPQSVLSHWDCLKQRRNMPGNSADRKGWPLGLLWFLESKLLQLNARAGIFGRSRIGRQGRALENKKLGRRWAWFQHHINTAERFLCNSDHKGEEGGEHVPSRVGKHGVRMWSMFFQS